MITYLKGDATKPIGEGEKLLCQINNDSHGWGAGFVLAVSARWKMPEYYYRCTKELVLGDVQFVMVEKDITVCNMIAQHKTGYDFKTKTFPIRYEAVRECLQKVNKLAVKYNATVHGPRFGSGLAGGDWNVIEKIIKEEITVDVFIYDLK